MPTITVTCAPLQPIERKRLALAFTRLLKAQGADTTHCMVFFNALETGCVFSAGMPLPTVDGHGVALQFYLRITLSAARDGLAHTALAEGLHRCLVSHYPNAFIYLQFDPILPEHVFYSAGTAWINAHPQQGKPGA
jgi:hypothetical protein